MEQLQLSQYPTSNLADDGLKSRNRLLLYSLGAIVVVPLIGPLIAYVVRSASSSASLDTRKLSACQAQIHAYARKNSTSKAVVEACNADLYDEKMDLTGVYKISLAAVIGCILVAWLVILATSANGHSKIFALHQETAIAAANARSLNNAASVQSVLKGSTPGPAVFKL